MALRDQLKKQKYQEIWQQYCGFLDLSMDGYMKIQRRLMEEQIRLWCGCGLGQSILKGRQPKNLEEFRQMVPLTTYDDYADILLSKQPQLLPGNPVIWIQTTWEGGKHPIKVAPYTRSMLNTYRNNVIACLILSTSTAKGKFDVSNTDKILYGLAPLPFATGLFPLALSEEADLEFLPAVKDAVNMSFSQRNKAGFKMAMKRDLEFFFGLGSVAYAVSQSLSSMGGSGKSMKISELFRCKPHMVFRLLQAKERCRRENRALMPKDLFRLKGFMVAGTDNQCYKDDLEKLWGIRPMELFAGTEPSIIGTETWTRKGMYFFPDTCFYEFITEKDMLHNYEDPSFVPPTYLMNEVRPGEKYELVLTVLKGGAFARYRCGDMYRCAGLEIKNWTAVKEYNKHHRPYLHMYVELAPEVLTNHALSVEILKELLSTYFKYIDQDYRDLKKILGMDPLEVTILRCGSFEAFEEKRGKKIRQMNPPYYELSELLRLQEIRTIRR